MGKINVERKMKFSIDSLNTYLVNMRLSDNTVHRDIQING